MNIIKPLTLPITNVISNTHNNPRPRVDFFATDLSTSYCPDQVVISDEISYSYDCTTSYPKDSVFQGSKLRIGINLYTYYLKAPSTTLNGS